MIEEQLDAMERELDSILAQIPNAEAMKVALFGLIINWGQRQRMAVLDRYVLSGATKAARIHEGV